jgi:hypothetical protein
MAQDDTQREWAAAAARRVIEDGLDYPGARRAAADAMGLSRRRAGDGPSALDIEDEVRAQLALFHADSQPVELRALRGVALRWMERLAAFRPHLGGAVWRGTATRLSAVRLDLYADDPKAPELLLLDRGVPYDVADTGADDTPALWLDDHAEGVGRVDVLLQVHDADALRGALQPDARGRSWRGPTAAVRALLDGETP